MPASPSRAAWPSPSRREDCQRRVQQAGAQFQRRGQHAGAGWTQPGQGGHCGRRALEQGAQRTVVGEQLAGSGDGVAPAQAGAEEKGQQLRVAEARRAAGQQLFTGAFVLGPVAYVHGHSVRKA